MAMAIKPPSFLDTHVIVIAVLFVVLFVLALRTIVGMIVS
jgi:hypothetical protein